MFDKTMVRGLLAVASTTAGRRVATFAVHGPWFRLGNIQIMALVFSVGVAFMAATARGDVFFGRERRQQHDWRIRHVSSTVNASLVLAWVSPKQLRHLDQTFSSRMSATTRLAKAQLANTPLRETL